MTLPSSAPLPVSVPEATASRQSHPDVMSSHQESVPSAAPPSSGSTVSHLYTAGTQATSVERVAPYHPDLPTDLLDAKVGPDLCTLNLPLLTNEPIRIPTEGTGRATLRGILHWHLKWMMLLRRNVSATDRQAMVRCVESIFHVEDSKCNTLERGLKDVCFRFSLIVRMLMVTALPLSDAVATAAVLHHSEIVPR
jgi:hypothetical protein